MLRAVAAPPLAAPPLAAHVARVNDANAWTRTLDLLARHRLTARAAIRLGAADLPEVVRAEVVAERRDAGVHALAAAAELTAVLRTLAAAGIPAMPFKGPTLALAVYGDLSARRMVDVDVVVSPADRQRALAVLASAGWQWPTAGTRTRDVLHHWLGHVPVVRAGAVLGVELHWRFAPLALPWTLPVEEVLRCAVPVALASDPLWRTPQPSDHLLLLAWHGTRHGWATLEWLSGFAHLLDACRPDEVDAAASTARRVGGARALGIAVASAMRAFDLSVPRSLERLAADPVARAEATRLVAQMWADPATETVEAHSWRQHGYWMRCLDSGLARARFIGLSAVLPTERELELIRLPEALAGLYYPLRVARVAARALSGRTA